MTGPRLTMDDLKKKSSLIRTLSDQLVNELGQFIVNGNFLPGERLEDESVLIERYKVSRSVVRDAIKILVGKGMLVVRRGIGTVVRPRSDWTLFDSDVLAWHQHSNTQPQYLSQLLDVRRAIEPKAAHWATKYADKEATDAIMAAYQQMEATVSDAERFVVADAQFHRSILHASGNEFLMALENLVFSALLSSIARTNRSTEDNIASLPLHLRVAEAILAGEAEQAEASMVTLLDDTKLRLDKVIDANRLTKNLGGKPLQEDKTSHPRNDRQVNAARDNRNK